MAGRIDQVPVKVYRGNGRLTVAAPMPGLEPQDIEVAVSDDGRLTLFGEQRGTLKGVNEVLMDEWDPGAYHREIPLDSPVNGPEANVTYENGVLTVSFPLGDSTRAARLRLDRVGPTEGKHFGASGHPRGSG
jgi:HSP20 family protein